MDSRLRRQQFDKAWQWCKPRSLADFLQIAGAIIGALGFLYWLIADAVVIRALTPLFALMFFVYALWGFSLLRKFLHAPDAGTPTWPPLVRAPRISESAGANHFHKQSRATSQDDLAKVERELAARTAEVETVRRDLGAVRAALDAKTKELDEIRHAGRAKPYYRDKERDDTIAALIELKPLFEEAHRAVKSMSGTASRYRETLMHENSPSSAAGWDPSRQQEKQAEEVARRKKLIEDKRKAFDGLMEKNYAAMNAARKLRENKEQYRDRVTPTLDPILELMAPVGNATQAQAEAIKAMHTYKGQISGTGLELASQHLVEKLAPYEQQLAALLKEVEAALGDMRER